MTACLADPLRFLIFSGMNLDKARNIARTDCVERGAVSIIQLSNSARGVLHAAEGKTGVAAECLNGVADTIKEARETSKVFDGVCKGANILGKMVNPLLCLASVARVARSENKKSTAVKEIDAMGLMFTGEGIFKRLFGLGGFTASYSKYKWINTGVNAVKKFLTTNKWLSRIPLGKWGTLLKAIGFVAVSCACFSIGAKLGDKSANAMFGKKDNHPAEKCALAVEPRNKDSVAEFVS